MSDSFKDSALKYHTHPTPGKLEIRPTKPLANKRDLSLAYSPGVAPQIRQANGFEEVFYFG